MNRDSNVYTVVYAAVMVILVAVLLAFTSQSLRSFQKANEDNDKRQQILRSVNVSVPANEAEAKYNELIKDAFLINANGEKVGDAQAAFVGGEDGTFPVFVANIDGQTKYIMAMNGAGRKWQPTPVFLPGESQGRGSLLGCRLWGRTESDTTEATQQQQLLLLLASQVTQW